MSLLASLDDRATLSINRGGVCLSKGKERQPVVSMLGHEDCLLTFSFLTTSSFIYSKSNLYACCREV